MFVRRHSFLSGLAILLCTGNSNARGSDFVEYRAAMGSRNMTVLISLQLAGRLWHRSTQHARFGTQDTKYVIDVMSKCREDVVRTSQLALFRCLYGKI